MPTMRQDARQERICNLTDAHSYHGSRFRKLRYLTSDREELLTNVAIPRGISMEIETESQLLSNLTAYAEVLEKICTQDFPDDFFRIETDGSLGHGGGDCYAPAYDGYRYGLEMPCQVMTKQRLRNEYRNFKTMYDVWFPRFQISCYHGKSCGMHVNVSTGFFGKTQAVQNDAMKKLIYFINKNYDLCCCLFARRPELTRWCGKMVECTDKDYVRNHLDLYHMPNDHGKCVNGAHIREPISSSRIELRLVGGQKNYVTFRNTMESVFHLCEVVKSISWAKIDDLTEVFNGCNQYVVKRLGLCYDDGLIDEATLQTIKDHSIFEDLELNR